MTNLSALKRQTFENLQHIAQGQNPAAFYHDDASMLACHPFNECDNLDAIQNFWSSLRHSFPDMERRDHIFVAGESIYDDRMPENLAGRSLIASMGGYQATFKNDFCGIPASGGVVFLRSCEVHHVIDGKIKQSYMLLDLLDLMRQVGVWPIAPSLGAEGMWQAPASQDAVQLNACDPEKGQQSMDVVLAMHHALLKTFDGKDINSMQHGQYWTENFMWYGPSGIGATRGMDVFRANHQVPFLTAFPDRTGAGHYVRVADGNFVVTGGWPSVVGTHTGEWLGMPPSGQRIDMRVMDFYRLEDGQDGRQIAENWVPIDMLHILKQMGVDVLARLAHQQGHPKMNL